MSGVELSLVTNVFFGIMSDTVSNNNIVIHAENKTLVITDKIFLKTQSAIRFNNQNKMARYLVAKT